MATTTNINTSWRMYDGMKWYDWLLVVIGSIAAMITGATIPAYNILFGDMMDKLNADVNGKDKEEVRTLCK